MSDSDRLSRRSALRLVSGAAGLSVTGMAAMLATSRPAQAKVPQKAVKYQDSPKGDQRCDNCLQFEAPSSCKTVDGVVAPEGWCMVYARKLS